MEEAVTTLRSAVSSGKSSDISAARRQLLIEARDPICDWLDKLHGHTVTDNTIFNSLPRHWEVEFHKDMDALNVLRPDVLTRVSEYIPEIVTFIEKIISNGLAYESNGSVYFSVNEFDSRPGHSYAKLVPEAYGDQASLQEGEGDLSSAEQQRGEKKSHTDFALWKKSKAGEPSWDSPWGLGRPGWHIECSVMASSICGSTLDIHTGGVDLKFPHHDNELAQTEAYFGTPDWVTYFLHSGHLTIAGCKMSKSLKNFVSIQQALQKHSARQLRFAFLLHSWKDTLDYSENTMEIAVTYEKLFNEFFLTVKDLTRDTLTGKTELNTFSKWNESEIKLSNVFTTAKERVHSALCDNIDTRTALDNMRELVTNANIYMREKQPDSLLLICVARYLTRMLSVFGCLSGESAIGFPMSGACTDNDIERTVMPYVSLLAEFRGVVRSAARTLKANDILMECDLLRDEKLPEVGIRLEDRETGPSVVKLVGREEALREKEARKKAEAEKAADKERKRLELARQQELKEAQRKIKPEDMFRSETDKYSKFDDKVGVNILRFRQYF